MTIRHSAFTFDAPAFVDRLRARCAASSTFEPAGLEAWARAVVDEASAARLAILEILRFDPEWLRPPSGEPPDARNLVLIVLGECLEPAPSLSRSHLHGYLILQTALTALHWPAPTVKSLVCGEPLDTLFTDCGIIGLAQEIAGFPWYVGWTGRSRAGGQHDELGKIATAIHAAPADLLTKTAEAIHAPESPAQQMLSECLADAVDMLDAASAGNRDLLLVLD
jgi:hypothetical protein